MSVWALYVAIVCSSPRMDYRSFYVAINHTPEGSHWMAFHGEDTMAVHYRLANTLADYADYSEQYRDKCK